MEKRISRHPERFGKGAIEGLAGPESANNAAAQASFIPLLCLGIPPNVVIGVIMGGLLMHGVVPGPRLIVDHRSEEHTSELQSLMSISSAVFCLKKNNTTIKITT